MCRVLMNARQAPCVVRTINGIRTETIDIKPRASANASCCIVFVPGNPGCIEFYSRFLLRLSDLSGARVLGIGLAGHSRRDLTSDRVFTLDEQVEHKFCALRDLIAPGLVPARAPAATDADASSCATPSAKPAQAPLLASAETDIAAPERLLICGHSIGAWIGLRALQELHIHALARDGQSTSESISTRSRTSTSLFFLGLAPTVELMAEQAGILRVVVAPPMRPALVMLLTALCAWLPRGGVEFVMRSLGGATSETVTVAVDAARRSFFANWLGLGELEFGTVGRITPALDGRVEASLAPEQKALSDFLQRFAQHSVSQPAPSDMSHCGGSGGGSSNGSGMHVGGGGGTTGDPTTSTAKLGASIATTPGAAASGCGPESSAGPLRLLYVQNDRWYTTDMIKRMQRHLSAAARGDDSASGHVETALTSPACCRIVEDATVSHDFVSSAAAVERMALEAVSDMYAMKFLRPLSQGHACAKL